MFKEIQVTLYDIFGYLMPGMILVFAIDLFFWTLFWPGAPLVIPSKLPVLALAFLLLIAYVAGHLAQAIGNFLEELPAVRKRLDVTFPLSPELERLLKSAVAARFGKAAESLKPRELFTLCDQALIYYDSPGEREIFVYREGFYRGTCVALAILALAMALRLIRVPAVTVVFGTALELFRGQVAVAGALTVLGAWLAYRRYLRFGDHLFRTCFLRFLSLGTSSSSERKTKHEPT